MPTCGRCNKRTFDGTKWNSQTKHREFNEKYLCSACQKEINASHDVIGQQPQKSTNSIMPRCQKCGNAFFIASMVSNYCRACLEKYPELKTHSFSCAMPKCIYYEAWGKVSLTNLLVPFNHDSGSHCTLLKKRIIIPEINCRHHKTYSNHSGSEKPNFTKNENQINGTTSSSGISAESNNDEQFNAKNFDI